MAGSKAVILVGGDTRGTRFRPISLSVPKVLFPAGGKPLLAHAVEAAIEQQANEILLIGYFENSKFDNFIADVNREYPNVTIRYLREYRPMGTAGGLYHFRDQILRGKPESIFLINADICCSYPLAELTKLAAAHKGSAVVLGTRVPKAISQKFGAIVADGDKVLHYVEKPESPVSTLVNGGIYLFTPAVFDVIAQAKEAHEKNEAMLDEYDEDLLQIEQDVLTRLADAGTLYVYVTTEYWRQVKEAGSALVANRFYLDDEQSRSGKRVEGPNIKNPVFIDPTAHIDPSALIGPNVTIGPGVKVGPGARIRDTVLLQKSEVRANALVMNAVLCPGVRVGKWARVEGSAVSPSDYNSTVIKDGVKAPRISILAEEVTVGEEVYLQNAVVLPHKDIKVDTKNEIVM